MKKQVNRKICIIFGVFFLFLYIQHQFVYMYFDDYGYASLSYGWSGNYKGMDYSLRDILRYLLWHYFCWGGRVFYYFFMIVALKTGLWFIQIFQAVIIFGITFFSYLLLKTEDENKNVKLAFLLCMFYGMIGLTTFNEGLFWYAAASSYVWPLLPFFAGIFVQKRMLKGEESKRNLILSSVLFFCAGFSQEQVAVLVFVYIVLSYGFVWFIEKRKVKGAWQNILAGALGSGLVILAPGNFVRAGTENNLAFSELSFGGKILENFPKILEINLGKDNAIFVLMLLLSGVLIAYKLLQKAKDIKKVWAGNLALSIFFSIGVIVSWVDIFPVWMENTLLVGWILLYCGNVTIYFWSAQKVVLLTLFYGGICSQGMMIVSPTIPMRCHILFEFILHMIVAVIFVEFMPDSRSRINLAVLYLLGGISLYNIVPITVGYYENYKIQQINNYKLIEKSKRIEAGMDCNAIVLYRLKDDRFASQMPYNVDFIQYWLKNYYEIPQEVSLIWERLDEQGLTMETVVSDRPKIISLYPEKIDETITYNSDGSVNIGVTPEIIDDNLQIMINGVEYATIIDNGFISTTVPAEVLKADFEVGIIDSATGKCSDTVIMKVSIGKTVD